MMIGRSEEDCRSAVIVIVFLQHSCTRVDATSHSYLRFFLPFGFDSAIKKWGEEDVSTT